MGAPVGFVFNGSARVVAIALHLGILRVAVAYILARPSDLVVRAPSDKAAAGGRLNRPPETLRMEVCDVASVRPDVDVCGFRGAWVGRYAQVA